MKDIGNRKLVQNLVKEEPVAKFIDEGRLYFRVIKQNKS